MSNFHKASNFTIEHLNQTDVRVDLEQQKHKAFERLLNEIVQGASHDSGERFDAPTCHPDTRTAVLDDIKSWVENDNESTRMMWLNGPAGAGKSAIAQTTAEDCHTEGRLIASFFFSRFVAGRNTKNGLIATIAYQLSVSIPGIREHIVDAIAKNPNIFKANIKTQFESLVVRPYRHLDQAGSDLSRPSLIIIDGLDECDNADHQAEIINALGTSILIKDRTSRFRILIASRPEARIRHAFDDEVVSTICTPLTLDKKYNPDKDIELFIRSSFQTLKRHHVLASMLQPWPPENTIQTIVKKSSGQFIYAATVMKYVSDSQQNPMKRLDIVLNITDAGGEQAEQPLAQLDALYTAILCNIHRDYKKVALIFEAIMFLEPSGSLLYPNEHLSAAFLDEFLYFGNEIPLFLADLSSIVNTSEMKLEGCRFYHASFSDYLRDSSRSQNFHIDECHSHAHLAICSIKHLAAGGLPEAVHYSAQNVFEHFKLSGWDNIVLDSMLSHGLLSVRNIRSDSDIIFTMARYHSDTYPTTFLGQLVSYTGDRKKVNDHYRTIIDAAFLNHLQQYEPHDILIVYYLTTWFPIYKDRLPQLMPALRTDSSYCNIIYDFSKFQEAREWFKGMMRNDRCLFQFSQDAYIKSTCYILDIFRDLACTNGLLTLEGEFVSGEKFLDYHGSRIPLYFFNVARELFDNLPVSNEIATAIVQKWESIQPTSEQLLANAKMNMTPPFAGFTFNSEEVDWESGQIKFRINLLEEIIQSYRMRTLKQNISHKCVQTETPERLSTAADSLTRYSPTTENYTYTVKLLILLLSIQFLLIAYMYMHFSGSYASSSIE